MRRVAIWAALVSVLAVVGCGGGGGPASTAPVQPFSFIWTATVSTIYDGFINDALHPNIAVGDTFTARIDYDPADFMDGGVTGDGRDYDAPANLRMVYLFNTGFVFERTIMSARARENGGMGHWSWNAQGSIEFRAEDPGPTFGGAFPANFDFVHNAFVSAQGNFVPGPNWVRFPNVDLDIERNLVLANQNFSVVAN